jgi:hypothetical protein
MHFKKFEYLRGFEYIFKKALAPKSGALDRCLGREAASAQSSSTLMLIENGNNIHNLLHFPLPLLHLK